ITLALVTPRNSTKHPCPSGSWGNASRTTGLMPWPWSALDDLLPAALGWPETTCDRKFRSFFHPDNQCHPDVFSLIAVKEPVRCSTGRNGLARPGWANDHIVQLVGHRSELASEPCADGSAARFRPHFSGRRPIPIDNRPSGRRGRRSRRC